MSPRVRFILVVLVLLMGAVGLRAYFRLYRQEPAPNFQSAEEHFLYGSVGTEAERGVPYWIWLVLPRIFPEYLPGPGGYASIGVLGRDGREMPIGFSKVTIGVPRVGVNCAMCHTASVRATPTGVPMIYPGAPAHQTGAQEYIRFLVACASDPRFTAGTILDEIARNVHLSLQDRLLYRFAIIPATRRALLRFADQQTFRRPAWGRGRADLVSQVKFTILQQPDDKSIGASDAMPLWNLRSRDGKTFQWDGSNTSLREVVQSAAIAEGATNDWMDADTAQWDRNDAQTPSSLRRVMDYVGDLKPPTYPFAVDATLAAAGAATYAATCAQCHDAAGARAHSAIPIDEIGTDRHRLDAWTTGAADAYNAFGEGHDWTFSSFRKTSGYVAPPLDGVWLSAPYLHNGSVPTLGDLLEPSATRPVRFWRGYDVYDQARVGFVSSGADAERAGTPFDVTQPGNGNGGHTYGTTLSAEEKRALIEYLKTR